MEEGGREENYDSGGELTLSMMSLKESLPLQREREATHNGYSHSYTEVGITFQGFWWKRQPDLLDGVALSVVS